MNIQLYLLLVLLVFGALIHSSFKVQGLETEWLFSTGAAVGVNLTEALQWQTGSLLTCTALDSQGNIIAAGHFRANQTKVGDYVLSNFEQSASPLAMDAFLMKLSPKGDVLWAKRVDFCTEADERLMKVAVDSKDNIVVGGTRLNEGPMLAVFDPNGQLKYGGIFDGFIGLSNSAIRALTIGADDRIFVGGQHINSTSVMCKAFFAKVALEDISFEWYRETSYGLNGGAYGAVIVNDVLYFSGDVSDMVQLQQAEPIENREIPFVIALSTSDGSILHTAQLGDANALSRSMVADSSRLVVSVTMSSNQGIGLFVLSPVDLTQILQLNFTGTGVYTWTILLDKTDPDRIGFGLNLNGALLSPGGNSIVSQYSGYDVVLTFISITSRQFGDTIYFGGPLDDVIRDAIVTSDNKIVLVGRILSSSVQGGPDQLPLSTSCLFVAKVSHQLTGAKPVIILDNDLYGDTLSNNFSYRIISDMAVLANLSIQEGTQLTIMPKVTITVETGAHLSANGLSNDKILFNSGVNASFCGFDVKGKLALTHVVIPTGGNCNGASATILLRQGSELVTSNTWFLSTVAPYHIYASDSKVTLATSQFIGASIYAKGEIEYHYVNYNVFNSTSLIITPSNAAEISITDNNFYNAMSGIQINNFLGVSRIRQNYFHSCWKAIDIYYSVIESIISPKLQIRYNGIDSCTSGMSINYFSGPAVIQGNYFNDTEQYIAFKVGGTTLTQQTVSIINNEFTTSKLATSNKPLVLLSSGEETSMEFRGNSFVEQRNNILLQISGPMQISRNLFYHRGLRVLNKTDSRTINVQLNYWGIDSMTQEQVGYVVGASGTLNPKMLYLPYLATAQDESMLWGYVLPPAKMLKMTDCISIQSEWGAAPSGIYQIYPKCNALVVYCDFDSSAGMTIQKRTLSYSFDKTWQEYVDGFHGFTYDDFFSGLENIHTLTNIATTKLHVQFIANDLSVQSIEYELFKLDSSLSNYSMIVGDSISSTGLPDEFQKQNGSAFATADHNDIYGVGGATQGGWWFSNSNSTDLVQLNSPSMTWGASFPDILNSKMTLQFVNSSEVRCGLSPKLAAPTRVEIEYCQPNLEFSVSTTSFPSLPFTINYSAVFGTIALKQYLLALHSPNVSISRDWLQAGIEQQITTNLLLSDFYSETPFLSTSTVVLRKQLAFTVVTDQSIIEMFPSNIVSVFANVMGLPSCWTSLNRQWTLGTTKLNSTANSTNVIVPRYLSVGDHTMTLTFALDSYLFSRDLVIKVYDAVAIDGGDRRIPFDYPITLNYRAAKYTNVNASYVWSCSNTTANLVPLAQGVVFSAATPGNYTVSVKKMISTVYPDRYTTHSIQIEVVPWKYLPVVSISTTGLSDIVSNQKKLKVEAKYSMNVNVNSSSVIYEWIVVHNNGSTVYQNKNNVLRPLILQENTLQPSTVYTIKISARNMQDLSEGYASITIRTASIPQIDNFTTTPTVGQELATSFMFSAFAHDSDSTQLQYSFYIVNGNNTTPLRLLGTSSFTTLMPRSNSSEVVVVKCVAENEYGSKSESLTTLSVKSNNNSMNILVDLLVSDRSSIDSEQLINIAVNVVSQKGSTMTQALLETVISNTTDMILKEIKSNSTASILAAVSNIHVLSVFSSGTTSNIRETTSSIIGTIMDVVLATDKTYSAIKLDDTQINQVAASISNVHSVRASQHDSSQMLSLIEKLGYVIATDKLAAEPKTEISTSTFDLLIQIDTPDNIRNSKYNTSDGYVGLPTTIDQLESDQEYTIELINFAPSNNPYSWSNSSKDMGTSIISFRLLSDQQKLPLRNMSSPIEIVLKKDQNYVVNDTLQHQYSCKFWDESTGDSWSVDGCKLYKETDSEIVCHCDHTTSFSAFVIYDAKAPNKASDGLYITYIVVYSLFIVLSVLVLIGVSVWNKKQPIRSRFIAPFIGLTAIIVECILNGVIRNALLIGASSAKDYRGVNSIAYIIMSIVNPIVLVSLFIYFWQMMRYLLMKNLYAIMGTERSDKRKLRLLKMVSSKLVYIILALLILVMSCVYFVLISILEATAVIKPNPASAFNALSFAAMSFAIAALIIALFVWDLVIVLTRKVYKRSLTSGRESIEGKSIELERTFGGMKALATHFTSDDPLQFRIESIFMVTGLIVMLISYIVGISDRFAKTPQANSGAKIVEFLFDVAYILLRIISFGGYTVIVRLVHRFKLHHQLEEYTALKSYVTDKSGVSTAEQKLTQLLRHDYGLEVFSNYAKKEFALENILLWSDLEQIRADNMVMTKEQRSRQINEIYSLYIEQGSDYEINVPAKCRQKIKILKEKDTIAAAEAEESLLNLYNEIMVNICDTFTRFSATEEYKKYVNLSSLAVHLMDTQDKKSQ